jgi:DNA primase
MVRGVALTYDGDAAGQQAMLRSLGVLLAEGLDVVVVDLPAGEDPDSLVRRSGMDGWSKVRGSAYDAVEFVHRHVLRADGSGDPRERALHVVVRLLTGVTDAIRHRLLVERASQVFGLSEAVIARAARAVGKPDPGADPLAAAVRAKRRIEDGVERQLLLGLLHVPELLAEARERLAPETFGEGGARLLAGHWWEHGVVLPEGDGEAAALARELASAGGEDLDQHAIVRGAIRQLRIRQLQRQRRARESELFTAREQELKDRLSREIQSIARELFELRQ